jgi:hypothetical protein
MAHRHTQVGLPQMQSLGDEGESGIGNNGAAVVRSAKNPSSEGFL